MIFKILIIIYVILAITTFVLFMRKTLTISNENKKRNLFYLNHKYWFYIIGSIFWPSILILAVISIMKGNYYYEKKIKK